MYTDDNEMYGMRGPDEDPSVHPDAYIYNNNNDSNAEKDTKETGRRKAPGNKRRGGMAGILAALCVASAIGGSLLTGYVISPAVSGGYPAAQASSEEIPATVLSSDVTDQSAVIGQSLPAASSQSQTNKVPAVAAKATPSVVGVKTYNKVTRGGETQTQDVAYGTGFIISSDGYIMTNSHVIEQGDYISVKLSDGTSYDATLQGQNYDSDVAVLKIDATGLTPVTIGDSDKLQVGQEVVVIGNPLGEQLANTVTVGYLSSLSRQIQAGDRTYNVLQTDAAINPGNSGGVMLDTNGEVIGMTTLKSMFAEMGSDGTPIPSEGIGFAIPINYAMSIAHQLIGEASA